MTGNNGMQASSRARGSISTGRARYGQRRIGYESRFLVNCHRKDKLEYCRELLIVPVTELLPQPAECAQMKEAITEPEDMHRCPHCGIGSMIRIAVLPCYRWPAVPPPDTS